MQTPAPPPAFFGLVRTSRMCELLGCSRSTLQRWIQKGVIRDGLYQPFIGGWQRFDATVVKDQVRRHLENTR